MRSKRRERTAEGLAVRLCVCTRAGALRIRCGYCKYLIPNYYIAYTKRQPAHKHPLNAIQFVHSANVTQSKNRLLFGPDNLTTWVRKSKRAHTSFDICMYHSRNQLCREHHSHSHIRAQTYHCCRYCCCCKHQHISQKPRLLSLEKTRCQQLGG